MTDAGVVDFYPDFMCFWCGDLDLFDGEVFAGFPGDSGLFGVNSYICDGA